MNFLNEYRSYFLCSLVSLLLIGNSSILAQSWDAERFLGIPHQDKQLVLEEEFETQHGNWKFDSQLFNERIFEGDYYCATLSSRSGIRSIPVSLDHMGDFEIEMRLRYARGLGTPAAGLYWGGDAEENGFSFNYDTNGQFAVSLHRKGHTYIMQPKTASPNLTRHSYNSLLMRKVGKKWYFFANQELVHTMPAQPLYGQEIGAFLEGRMAIEIDFIRVTQLTSSYVLDQAGPAIDLASPLIPASGMLSVSTSQQVIKGTLSDASELKTLTINGKFISFGEDGSFSASVYLPEGTHEIKLVANDQLGNENTMSFQISYQEAPEETSFSYEYEPPKSYQKPVSEPAPFTAPTSNDHAPSGWEPNPFAHSTSSGQNYLLLIGVNRYDYWTPLYNAVKDCEDIARVLTEKYQFDREHLIVLYNEQATRENILETFESLQEKLGPEDNLLIYYAGHGFYDEGADLGYWVPVNARVKKVPDFIRNSTIHDYLRAIDTKHTFLIADACYAGSLFGTYRGATLREDVKSRWAFTSGNIEKVWDGQPGENSPFADYLIRYLQQNQRAAFPANELIETVGIRVQNNTRQSPQGSSLRRAGDEGGVFMFRRK
jgi:hypothetical protein